MEYLLFGDKEMVRADNGKEVTLEAGKFARICFDRGARSSQGGRPSLLDEMSQMVKLPSSTVQFLAEWAKSAAKRSAREADTKGDGDRLSLLASNWFGMGEYPRLRVGRYVEVEDRVTDFVDLDDLDEEDEANHSGTVRIGTTEIVGKVERKRTAHHSFKGYHDVVEVNEGSVIWKGFEGKWTKWEVTDGGSLIGMSLWAGLSVGNILVCASCCRIATRKKRAGRQLYCGKCQQENKKADSKAQLQKKQENPLEYQLELLRVKLGMRVKRGKPGWTKETAKATHAAAKVDMDKVRQGTLSLAEWSERWTSEELTPTITP